MTENDTDEKIKGFTNKFIEHGISCGAKIAEIAKIIHPNALLIVSLYRSCIVIEKNEEDNKEGDCTIHAYADPHWIGGEIDIETLKSGQFHKIFKVQGDRQGPSINEII